MCSDVADGDKNIHQTKLIGDLAAPAGQRHQRLARRLVEYFYVRPVNPVSPTCSENLEHGLLGGKTPGEMLGLAFLSEAVFQLGLREDAIEKMSLVPIDRFTQPVAIHHINAMANHVHS